MIQRSLLRGCGTSINYMFQVMCTGKYFSFCFFANSDGLDAKTAECGISSGYALFAKTKTIFRERNSIFIFGNDNL